MRQLLRFFLLFSVVLAVKGDGCVARCERLHQRSIQRIGFDVEKVARLLEKQRPAGTLKDICWRLFDKLDCMKRCPHDKEIEKYGRDVRFKCKGVLGELAGQLKCVSRYRSFIQIKCSTFLKEAVSSRVIQAEDTVPDKDTCRYLHLNSLCLENTVGNYCPSATAIFRRLNFRDYFLNFIIPDNDHLFDDVDLDSCQIYDFVKSVHKPNPSLEEDDDELTTIVNQWEDDAMTGQTEPVTTTTESTTTMRERERQEFTTLLNELLDSTSTEIAIPGEETTTLTRVTSRQNHQAARGEDVTESISITTADGSPEMVETTGSQVMVTEGEGTSPSYTRKTVFLKEDLVTDVTTARTSTLPQSSSSVTTNRVTTDNSAEEETSTLIEIPSNKRKVFSDDSMENTPPNFFYSSARYRTSTLSANHGEYYSSTERDREIVRPVEVDTSTLLGDDFPQGPVETEPVPWMTTKAPEVIIPTPEIVPIKYTSAVPKTTTRISVTYRPTSGSGRAKGNRGRTTPKPGEVPLLNGGQVIVKSIKRWGEPESDEEIREVEKIQRSPVVDEEDLDKIMGKSSEQYEYVDEVTTRDASSNGRLTENEILIFIYLVLCALALVALICVLLFCICCRRKSSPDFNKY